MVKNNKKASFLDCPYRYGVVHAEVKCENCGWECESYKNAQALAKQHAVRYGHNVTGQLGIAFDYYGAERRS